MPHIGEVFPPAAQQGVFTPDVIGTTTAGVATYAANGQMGRWARMGNLVFVWGLLNWTAHTGTGNLRIAGLPFPCANVTGMRFNIAILPGVLTYVNDIIGNINAGQDWIEPRTYVTGANTSLIPMDTAANMQFNGFYLTDA